MIDTQLRIVTLAVHRSTSDCREENPFCVNGTGFYVCLQSTHTLCWCQPSDKLWGVDACIGALGAVQMECPTGLPSQELALLLLQMQRYDLS